jgi:large subunit ribosomal protein L21
MYAVIKSGGKQYRVAVGLKMRLEKLAGAVGDTVTFDEILLVGSGENVTIGQPRVAGAKVAAKILEQDRARKIEVVKFKRRKGYAKKQGHRQAYTQVEFTEVAGPA